MFISKQCVVCNSEFLAHPKALHSVTCSKPCSIKYNNRKAVESGRKKVYAKRWREKYKEQIRQKDLEYVNQWRYGGNRYKVLERDNYMCQYCQTTEQKALVVHHIDEVIENTSMDNLITICNACHARIHHGGSRNAKYKQVSRDDVIEAINSTPNLEEAAKKLGITRKTLRKKRELYGLPELNSHGNPVQT